MKKQILIEINEDIYEHFNQLCNEKKMLVEEAIAYFIDLSLQNNQLLIDKKPNELYEIFHDYII